MVAVQYVRDLEWGMAGMKGGEVGTDYAFVEGMVPV